MDEIAINKPKTLKGQILDMQAGTYLFVPFREYTEMHVRKIVRILNRNGYSYRATSAGVIDGINVIKLK